MGDLQDGDLPATLTARLLGRAEIAVAGRIIPTEAWPNRPPRLLLLLLLGVPGHRLPRDRVLDVLWPDAAPTAALNALYKAVHALRRILEPDLRDAKASAYLRFGDETLWLAPAGGVQVDADRFEETIGRASLLPATERRATFRAALAEYRGDFLADEPYADWPISRREALRRARERATIELAALDLDAGEPLLAVPLLDTLLRDDPTGEEAHRALMRGYAAAGQRERALRQFARCREALQADLGSEPTPETFALRDTIERAPAADVPVVTAASLPPFDNLPAPATPLVAREREVDNFIGMLGRDDVRLVTLTGSGGVGKTRLAIEVAAQSRGDFRDGVAFVPLAPLHDPALVIPTIARTFGLHDQGGSSPAEVLHRHLRVREVLLVLDNCEHVLGAAPAVAGLLAACPGLKILATSREVLYLRGEHELPLDPLSLPNPDRLPPPAALERYGAAALFLQVVRTFRPDFSLDATAARLIAEICLRLDGLPLAIELAAARLRSLPLARLHALLDRRLDILTDGPRDLPERQRTLRAAITWSHDLLDDRERALFRRLAVFAGGWSGEAATAVTGVDDDRILSALAEKHLIGRPPLDGADRVEPHWSMLETIREFGLETLEAAGEAAAARAAHAAWYLALAERAEPDLNGADQATWLDRLETEHANLRAALDWALVQGTSDRDARLGLRLAGAIWRFWEIRGHLSEGRGWLERALAANLNASPVERGKALGGAGTLAERQADPHRAYAYHEAALAAARSVDDRARIARALNGLGNVVQDRGEYARAAKLYDEALTHGRSAGDNAVVGATLNNLGSVAYYRGDYAEAEALWEEAVTALRAAGEPRNEAQTLGNLAVLARRRRDLDRARGLDEASLTIRRRVGDKPGIAGSLSNLAGIAKAEGDDARATALYEEAARLLGKVGDERGLAIVLYNLGLTARSRGEPRQAVALLVESLGLFRRTETPFGLAAVLEELAGLLTRGGQPTRAARLFGAAAALREATGISREAMNHGDYEAEVAATRTALEESAFSAAWDAGRALTAEQAVTDALAGAAALSATPPIPSVAPTA